MKGKCIFSITIVITLAVLAAAALVCSMPVFPANKIPEGKMVSAAGNVMEPGNTAESEQNITGGFRSSLKAGVSPQGAMKILMLLFSMGNIIYMQIRRENVFRAFVGITYTAAVTFSFGKWSIYMACLERGYEAVGGEYCLIFAAGWAAGTAIGLFFDSLENLGEVKLHKKKIWLLQGKRFGLHG